MADHLAILVRAAALAPEVVSITSDAEYLLIANSSNNRAKRWLEWLAFDPALDRNGTTSAQTSLWAQSNVAQLPAASSVQVISDFAG